jgi:hypothetical protein
MRRTVINEIERFNMTIFILGSLGSLVVTRQFTYFFSFAVGSAIMTLNFRFLKRIVEGTFLGPEVNKMELIKLPIKFLILAGLVVVVMVFGDVNIPFFVAGLSTVFFSLVLSQLMTMFSRGRRKENGA